MPVQSRRTHTKSRGGCFECKRRKIKCDEQRPTCSGCDKRSIACEYAIQESSPRSDGILSPTRNSDITSSSISPGGFSVSASPDKEQRHPTASSALYSESPNLLSPLKTLGQFDKEDIALWHHFVTETAATMSNPWEKELPLLAFHCDFLMHGILSTAALHLAYKNPDQREKFNFLSVQHQEVALGPFRQAMSNITSDNCNQIFAFSMLLLTSQFASFQSPAFLLPSTEATSYRVPANWIMCLRGCSSIYRQASLHINSGPAGTLISLGTMVESAATSETTFLGSEDNRSLGFLAQNLLNLPTIKSSTTVTEMEAYVQSITWLCKLLTASSEISDTIVLRAYSSLWPVKLDDTFIRLLGEQRPPALIIVAHYCLLLKRCESCWFMKQCAYDLLEAILQDLPEEWLPYVEHPMLVIQAR